MQNILDKLADDIKKSVANTSAKVAEIHRLARPENDFQRGYNAACEDIARKIREMM